MSVYQFNTNDIDAFSLISPSLFQKFRDHVRLSIGVVEHEMGVRIRFVEPLDGGIHIRYSRCTGFTIPGNFLEAKLYHLIVGGIDPKDFPEPRPISKYAHKANEKSAHRSELSSIH